MKNLRIFLFSATIILLAAGSMALKNEKKTNEKKVLTLFQYYWDYNAAPFQIGSLPGDEINTSSNWSSGGSSGTGGSLYLAQVDASYAGSIPLQTIINEVRVEYLRLNSLSPSILLSVFVDGYSWGALYNGQSVNLKVYLRDF